MIYVLNVPVLPNYGTYTFKRVGVDEAKELLKQGFVSAVGHKGTSELLSDILGIKIQMSRIQITMDKGDKAIAFRLLVRLPEGAVLSKEELEKIPYELGLLERVE